MTPADGGPARAPADLPAGVPAGFRPATSGGRAGLAALLADPGHALIGLDFDGTLSAIVDDPARARPYPGAIAALTRLAPLVGTLAIITGRGAGAVVEYGGLDAVPGLIVLGHYGWERWAGGEVAAPPSPPGLAAAREQLPGVLAAAGAPPGTWTEDKGHALAVHTRRTSDPDGALARLREPVVGLAAAQGLLAQPGRMVLEMRPRNTDKGSALKALSAERSAQAVLFGGDDLGDIPAFEAIGELRGAGVPGVAVCSGSAEVTELAPISDLVVDGPAGVIALLDWLAAEFG